MSCPLEVIPPSLPPEGLAAALRRVHLPDDASVEVSGDRVWVLFPESDFAIRLPVGPDGRTRLSFSAALRAPEPSLETWWDQWLVDPDGHDLTAEVLDEVLAVRGRFLRMLADPTRHSSGCASSEGTECKRPNGR
jgi:hypothetical protein